MIYETYIHRQNPGMSQAAQENASYTVLGYPAALSSLLLQFFDTEEKEKILEMWAFMIQ